MAEQSDDPTWLATAGAERSALAAGPASVRQAARQLTQANASTGLAAKFQLALVETLIHLREDAQIVQFLANGHLNGLSVTRLRMLQADLANPFRVPGRSEDEWVSTLQPLFGDLAPVHLAPKVEGDGREPLDRLTTHIEASTTAGPLVSVVVSSYRPGPSLETSVRSLLSQTWRELEVLVVDDASGPEFAAIYAHIAALDERVRVIRQTDNRGTYAARNVAIDQARGTYITFQDADDWSHPERIERQVAVLEGDPLAHSVRARSLRTSGSLVFSLLGNKVLAPGAVTIMFRREQVWPVLGGYDTVRKAADTEFHERISAALPGHGVDLHEPLLWYRLGEGSLSRNEFRAAWRHSSRFLYQSAWGHWHKEIRLGASPRLDRSTRPFPTPARFEIDRLAQPEAFDLVLLGDWRGDSPVARDAVDWIRVLAADGVKIALVHAESLNLDGPRPLALMPSVQNLVAHGTVQAVPWDDPITASALVVIEPEVVDFLPDTPPGARADTIIVLRDDAPRTETASAAVEEIVRDRWAARVRWSHRTSSPETITIGASDALDLPFPRLIPGTLRVPLHRPNAVVVVIPIGFSPEVLNGTATAVAALADAGFDSRVHVASGLRPTLQQRVGSQAFKILWSSPTDGPAAADLAVATDVVIVGCAAGIDYDRLIDDARVRSVRTHLLDPAAGIDQDVAESLIDRIRNAPPPTSDTDDGDAARSHAEAILRAWYERVKALD